MQESRTETDAHIAAFYCFVPLADADAVAEALRELGKPLDLRGSIIVAPEGFNGTVAGSRQAMARLEAHLRTVAGTAAIEIKYATADRLPFGRFKVRRKAEIVTLGVAGLEAHPRGAYVDPADWNAVIARPGTILVDTRNSYEVATGTFRGAIDPGTRSFTQFPDWLAGLAESLSAQERAERPLAMFCTGGIRCEKSTALAHALGFGNVLHLKGGILAYLEQVAEGDSLWEGDCFVFDERVAVGHGLTPGRHRLCRACGMPVPEAEWDAHALGCGGTG